MPTSTVHYSGNLRTLCTHIESGEHLHTDAPRDNKGLGQTFSPTDLAATSLASCMLTLMGIYARERGIVIGEVKAEVIKVMAEKPRRISEIHIRMQIPERNLSSKDRKGLHAAAKSCPVALSLHPDILQKLEIVYPD